MAAVLGMTTALGPTTAVAATRDWDLAGKRELTIAVPCNLRMEQGPVSRLVVEAESDVLDALRLVTEGARATLDAVRNIKSRQGIRIRATLPQLNAFSTRSAVHSVFGSWTGGRLLVNLDGSGQVQFEKLALSELVAELRGASELSGAGQVASQSYLVDGAGTVDAQGLAGANVRVVIRGSGEATVKASHELNVEISGVGNVRYLGQPKVRKQINGVGSVEPL